MGRIRQTYIKRAARRLLERYPDKFSTDYKQNRRALEGLDDARLDTPYRQGGWTARQVVPHLADSHLTAPVPLTPPPTAARPARQRPAPVTLPEAIPGQPPVATG